MRYGADEVQLTIRNAASVAGADPALASGTGLLGLRQRVEPVDGTLEAGPCLDGGFRLAVTLPAEQRRKTRSAGVDEVAS